MKKNILFAILATGCLLTHTACEDGKDDFLSDFSTIVYFRNSGEQPLTAYVTGDNIDYKLIVNKAGSELNRTSSVKIAVMSEAALQAYNTLNGNDYKAYPSSCYTFENGDISFSSSDLYHTRKVSINPSELENYVTSDATYVIPFELTQGTDSINSEKKYVFIKAVPEHPIISFEQSGYFSNWIGDDGTPTATLSNNLLIPLPNKWGLTCKVEVAPEALDEYNAANGTNWVMMDSDSYEFTPTASFEENGTTAPFNITVNKESLQYGEYIIPLKITEASNDNFWTSPQSSVALVGISFNLPQIQLTSSMLSSNWPEPSEGSLANLLDGNVDTYFHSAWSIATTGEHYVQVALTEPIQRFLFSYTTRSSNGNANPAELYVSVSSDGQSWTEVERFTQDFLPTGAAESWTSPRIETENKDIKYIRITNVKSMTNNPFFVWSEFALFGR